MRVNTVPDPLQEGSRITPCTCASKTQQRTPASPRAMDSRSSDVTHAVALILCLGCNTKRQAFPCVHVARCTMAHTRTACNRVPAHLSLTAAKKYLGKLRVCRIKAQHVLAACIDDTRGPCPLGCSLQTLQPLSILVEGKDPSLTLRAKDGACPSSSGMTGIRWEHNWHGGHQIRQHGGSAAREPSLVLLEGYSEAAMPGICRRQHLPQASCRCKYV